jgi:hypothetical protein
MPHFEGALGCLRKSWVVEEGKNRPHLWSWLDSNMRSRLDLMENPKLMEKDPQPIPRISKVVGSLQAYIRRPSHGEKDMEILRDT